MAVRNYSLGQLNPVVYFINSRGEVSLPPSTEQAMAIKDRMSKRGWELREARNLEEIDRLQARMEAYERQARERQLHHEENLVAASRKSVRDRLIARMTSSSTPTYEREFIQQYLMLRAEKREEYRNRYMADQSYFVAREMDAKSAENHLQNIADRIPDSRDTECVKCHSARRMVGYKICAKCLGALAGRQV